MIRFSEGNIHDIDHFIRVWTYAKTIGELEQIDEETQCILEVAAITHDMMYIRDDDQHRAPFGEPPVVCNYFYHEEITKTAKKKREE